MEEEKEEEEKEQEQEQNKGRMRRSSSNISSITCSQFRNAIHLTMEALESETSPWSRSFQRWCSINIHFTDKLAKVGLWRGLLEDFDSPFCRLLFNPVREHYE